MYILISATIAYWWESLYSPSPFKLTLRVHQLEKNPNIFFTFFYIVGRESRKKLVYEIQIWAQKLCILTCAHKISCCAFESVISARCSAREIFFAKAMTIWGRDVNRWLILPLFLSFSFFSFLKYPTENRKFRNLNSRRLVRVCFPLVYYLRWYLLPQFIIILNVDKMCLTSSYEWVDTVSYLLLIPSLLANSFVPLPRGSFHLLSIILHSSEVANVYGHERLNSHSRSGKSGLQMYIYSTYVIYIRFPT